MIRSVSSCKGRDLLSPDQPKGRLPRHTRTFASQQSKKSMSEQVLLFIPFLLLFWIPLIVGTVSTLHTHMRGPHRTKRKKTWFCSFLRGCLLDNVHTGYFPKYGSSHGSGIRPHPQSPKSPAIFCSFSNSMVASLSQVFRRVRPNQRVVYEWMENLVFFPISMFLKG